MKPLYPDLSERHIVITGQVVTAVTLLVAILWAPQIQRFETLWGYLQLVLAYTTPPIVATFVGGIFWARVNRHGAFVTLLLGVGLGVVFFVLNEILGVFAIQFLYVRRRGLPRHERAYPHWREPRDRASARGRDRGADLERQLLAR